MTTSSGGVGNNRLLLFDTDSEYSSAVVGLQQKNEQQNNANQPPPLLQQQQQQQHNSASLTSAKVSEVFLTAGQAFQKLGDLTLRLQAPISEHSDETKWGNAEVEMLKEALDRFAYDLEAISNAVRARTIRNIKTDIKRTYNSAAQSSLLQAPLPVTTIGSNFSSSQSPSVDSLTSTIEPTTGQLHSQRIVGYAPASTSFSGSSPRIGYSDVVQAQRPTLYQQKVVMRRPPPPLSQSGGYSGVQDIAANIALATQTGGHKRSYPAAMTDYASVSPPPTITIRDGAPITMSQLYTPHQQQLEQQTQEETTAVDGGQMGMALPNSNTVVVADQHQPPPAKVTYVLRRSTPAMAGGAASGSANAPALSSSSSSTAATPNLAGGTVGRAGITNAMGMGARGSPQPQGSQQQQQQTPGASASSRAAIRILPAAHKQQQQQQQQQQREKKL